MKTTSPFPSFQTVVGVNKPINGSKIASHLPTTTNEYAQGLIVVVVVVGIVAKIKSQLVLGLSFHPKISCGFRSLFTLKLKNQLAVVATANNPKNLPLNVMLENF